MANDEFDRLRHHLERIAAHAADVGPDWPEATINLIDALRAYIKVDQHLGRDLFQDGSITRVQYDEGMAALEPMIVMLRTLETWELDPTLDGLLE